MSDNKHDTEVYSKHKNKWDLSAARGIGGPWFFCSNLSLGYHGILRQYWDKYVGNVPAEVLIVSDNNQTKKEFNAKYPKWNITTIDLFPEIKAGVQCDIVGDICASPSPLEARYDLIINQANLEHMYDPMNAIRNLCNALNPGGYLLTHTHPPRCPYHQYPRDYFRFMKDWWYDLPKYVQNIELLELYMWKNEHVFTVYQKA